MEHATSSAPKPLQIASLAGLATLTSSVVAVAVHYAVRMRRRAPRSVTYSADQLEVETVPSPGSSHTPDHFSEDVILPGFTATGAQVREDGITRGRSPEGV